MQLVTKGRIVAWPVIVIGALLIANTICYAFDSDAYLKQIEEEAKRQAATPTTTTSPTPVAPAGPGPLAPRERLPLGLRQDAFEELLHREFMGTFTFYQRLSRADQRRVFESYKKDNRVSTIRDQTLRFFGGTR
jgi:hypothetical protein